MKTSDKIIGASIDLFNRERFRNVSLKEIAEAAEISPGNLTYHFPTKVDLVKAVFDKMFKEMEDLYEPDGLYGLREVDQMFCEFFNFQERYIFFFLDIVDIMKEYAFISKPYNRVVIRRLEEGEALIAYLVGRGLLKEEMHCGDYQDLIRAIWTISTFWPSQRAILEINDTHKVPLRIIWQQLYSQLTENGRKEYRQTINY